MSSISFESVLLLVITGIVWGISTPLLKRYSQDIDDVHHSNPIIQFILQLKSMFTNWRYLLSFVFNQSGSVLYTISLSYNPITIAVPITNALNFIFVVISGPIFGETTLDFRSLLGASLVMTGIVLCLLS
ncbi:unnamed protein product [Medioppia subpectinata]|uniref:Transmembrane protein 234 n=1 Tax=Medioppia subpectinata TaxID=1979941 RepID=A0A7R9LYV5_9ACAR|nr:unnamed protein product [Medioppia subpectinata]CAG2122341.1 unnamed protein product [Medioppia subpectinata]